MTRTTEKQLTAPKSEAERRAEQIVEASVMFNTYWNASGNASAGTINLRSRSSPSDIRALQSLVMASEAGLVDIDVRKVIVSFACKCAEEVLPATEKEPREGGCLLVAIEAAKVCIEKPTKESKAFARRAEEAARGDYERLSRFFKDEVIST